MAKPRHPESLQAIEDCRFLGFVLSELSGGVLVYIPTFAEFKPNLDPMKDESEKVRAFRSVTKFFEKMTRVKDGNGRWFLWETGAWRIDAYQTKNGIKHRRDKTPPGLPFSRPK